MVLPAIGVNYRSLGRDPEVMHLNRFAHQKDVGEEEPKTKLTFTVDLLALPQE
jgi:hypothetical protein